MTVITQDDHAFAYPHSDTLLCSIVTFLGFLILLSVFWFFRESFSFPWATWFYHELFAFADSFFELFGFAVSFLLLPWAIWFCRELFGFALSFLVFPWVIWFFLELFGFSVSYLVSPWAFGFTITVVGHRTNRPLVIMGHVTWYACYCASEKQLERKVFSCAQQLFISSCARRTK